MIIDSKMTRNRAEEYGFDLWKEFVVPPYFLSLKTLKSEKPLIIEGGRGSGKTMLLRYPLIPQHYSLILFISA